MMDEYIEFLGRAFCVAVGIAGLLVVTAEWGNEATASFSGATPDCTECENTLPPSYAE